LELRKPSADDFLFLYAGILALRFVTEIKWHSYRSKGRGPVSTTLCHGHGFASISVGRGWLWKSAYRTVRNTRQT
jgi:hypothetical protein